MNRRVAVLACLIAIGAALGSVLAAALFSLLRSRGVEMFMALGLSTIAFFFGLVLLTLVLRIVLAVACWPPPK